jgi:2'-5' RNA ligase
MDRKKEYSLWLMPNGKEYERARDMILKIAKNNSAPVFEPHVTLLGDIAGYEEEVSRRTSELAGKLKPFRIRLIGTGYLESFFRCLFIKAGKTKQLMKANDAARKIFGRRDDRPFMPHLSILYGHYSPESKEKIIKDIGRFKLEFVADRIFLVSSSSEIPIKEWRVLEEFRLKATSQPADRTS